MKEGLSRDGETASGMMMEEKVEEGSEQGDEEEEAEGEGEEVRVSVGKKSPKDPTRRQREEHERTHLPYRS